MLAMLCIVFVVSCSTSFADMTIFANGFIKSSCIYGNFLCAFCYLKVHAGFEPAVIGLQPIALAGFGECTIVGRFKVMSGT